MQDHGVVISSSNQTAYTWNLLIDDALKSVSLRTSLSPILSSFNAQRNWDSQRNSLAMLTESATAAFVTPSLNWNKANEFFGEQKVISVGNVSLSQAAFNSKGELLIVGVEMLGGSRIGTLITVSSLAKFEKTPYEPQFLSSLCFYPDGRTLLVGGKFMKNEMNLMIGRTQKHSAKLDAGLGWLWKDEFGIGRQCTVTTKSIAVVVGKSTKGAFLISMHENGDRAWPDLIVKQIETFRSVHCFVDDVCYVVGDSQNRIYVVRVVNGKKK